MPQKKKTSYRALVKQCASLTQEVVELRSALRDQHTQRLDLERRLSAKVDTTMMQGRNEMLRHLGQMVEAVSQAVRITIGKEVF